MSYYLPFGPEIKLGQTFGSNPNWGPNPAGGHNGDDWLTQVGVPIRAAGNGEVLFAGRFDNTYADNWGWNLNFGGQMIVLNMDGADGPYFEYGHLSKLYVVTGQRVKAGDIIGLTGADDGGTGVITGPHCHVGCLPPNFNLNTPTYGRVNPRLYMTKYWTDSTLQYESAPAPAPTPTEEDDEVYVIAHDPSAADPDTVWIGNGIHRRHIPDTPTLEAMQQLARWGVLKVFKDGEVQTIPTNALGVNLDATVTSNLLNTPVPRQGRGAELGENTSLGAIVAWFDNATISLLDAIHATASEGGATVEQITAALKESLANGIKIDVTATASVKE